VTSTGARTALEQAAQEASARPTSPSRSSTSASWPGTRATCRLPAPAYEAGLAADPTSLALLAGRAKVTGAEGDTAAALADHRSVVERSSARPSTSWRSASCSRRRRPAGRREQ
jgi:hypothetical protein